MWLLAVWWTTPETRADDGAFDAHGFALGPLTSDPVAPLVLPRPAAFEAGSAYVGAVLERAESPLVLVTREAGVEVAREPVLDDVYAVNLSAGYAPTDWLRLGAKLPVYLSSVHEGGEHRGVTDGDLRLDGLLLLRRPDDTPLGVGVAPFLDVPFGGSDWLGDNAPAVGGRLVATTEVGRLAFTVGGGARVPTGEGAATEGLLGAGAGLALGRSAGLNLELDARLPLGEDAGAPPVEALTTLRGRAHSGLHLLAGAAVALTDGVGAAQYRLFLGGGWGGGHAGPRDRDGDGVTNEIDRCPDDAENPNGREDGDGCPEAESPITLRVRALLDGAPVEGADLVMTSGGTRRAGRSGTEAWVQEVSSGESWKIVATQGPCLQGEVTFGPDEGELATLDIPLEEVRTAAVRLDATDADGQPLAGAAIHLSAASPGCVPDGPQHAGGTVAVSPGPLVAVAAVEGWRSERVELVAVQGSELVHHVVLTRLRAQLHEREIALSSPVVFEAGTATLRPDSALVLEEVLGILRDHPELLRVEVAGHTDADGGEAANLALSRKRVEVVRRWLVERGVAPERLAAVGYGETQPLDTNATERGRAANRRVEFRVLQRAASAPPTP